MMRKSSTSKSRNLNNPSLSIDLKPFYNFQSSSDSEEKLLKFGSNRKAKYDRTKDQNVDDPTDLYYCTSTTTTKYRNENDDDYSDKSDEDVDYGEYENPNIRKASTNLNRRYSHHHQNRRHHSHQHRRHSNQNYANTNDFNEAFSRSRSQKNDKKDDLHILYRQKEIENGFDNNFNYQKIPYNKRSKNDINNQNDLEPNTPSFEDIYHFTCKQVNLDENLQIEDENIRTKDYNMNHKKKQEDLVFNYVNYYPEKVAKAKMVFHDSDQIDDSLNIFIEEEEYYDNKRKMRKGHHHHQKGSHHRKTKERSAASIERNNTYNIQKRKPLNQYYQKYLNKNKENDSNFVDDNQIDKNYCSDEYSIFDFSEKAPPVAKLYQQNNSPPNATISFSNGRNNKSKMKFVQSEEISSGKVNDYLGSSDGQEIAENQPQTISDLDLNENIDLKITVKDTIEGNKEKVHKYSIYSLKDSQNREKIKIEEEEEEVENIKVDSGKITNELKIQIETQMPQSNENNKNNRASPNSKNSSTNNSPTKSKNSNNSPTSKSNISNRNKSPNAKSNISNNNNSPNAKSNISNNNNSPNAKSNITNSKSSPNSKSNNRNNSPNSKSTLNNRKSSPNNKKYENNKNEIDIEEEEEENDVASFRDVSTSFDSQNQFNDNKNHKFEEENNAENEDKKYKTAEINVTLKGIRDANKSTKKRKRKQANDPTIVTTHRRKVKRLLYRKKLVNKSVQTIEVENPTMTLAMIQPF